MKQDRNTPYQSARDILMAYADEAATAEELAEKSRDVIAAAL